MDLEKYNIEKFNIIESDEVLIGKALNTIEAFLEIIKTNIEIEDEILSKIENIQEEYIFVTELAKDLKDKIIDSHTIIKVKYNNMGCYYYELI